MKKKLAIITVLLILLSGCTKRFEVKNEKDESVKTYVSNIVCRPESKELIKIYEENEDKINVDFDKLPLCKDLKINSGGYEGLWTSIFVKPLSWIIIKLGQLVKNYGISIMIVGVLLRLIMMPISKKSTNMSANLKKAQRDLDSLERKYSGKEDKEAMMMKSQEMMMIYKKYDINPFSSCLFAFLQMPIFFAFLEAVYRVPAFFEETLWKFNLGMTPKEGFAVGNYWYIILIILIALATYFTFKNVNTTGNTEQRKQTKMMSMFMLVFIVIASFTLPTAIALYWIVSNSVSIIQNLIIKKGSK